LAFLILVQPLGSMIAACQYQSSYSLRILKMPVASPVAVPVALPVTLQTSAIKTMLYIFHAQHLCEARMMQFLSEKGVNAIQNVLRKRTISHKINNKFSILSYFSCFLIWLRWHWW
jgi:hypothetical protein